MDGHEHGKPSVDPAVTQRIVWALVAICAAFVLVDVSAVLFEFPYHKHGHYDFELYPGFHAFYGFISCVLLVLAARELRKFVMRGEDFYD